MKKIICLILVTIMMFSVVGCSNKNETVPPYEHVLINENDNDGTKVAKSAINQLIDFWNEDMGIIHLDNNPNNSVRTAFVRENGNEIMYSSDISYLAMQKNNGENYILHINNTFEKIDEKLPRLITDTYNRYITLISWLLEDPDKYTWNKNVNEDNTITYYFVTEFTDYYVDKYKQYFSGHEMLSPYDKCFETAITVNIDGELVQIDWFASNEDESMIYEMATQFTKDLESVYLTMGEGIKDIWKVIP